MINVNEELEFTTRPPSTGGKLLDQAGDVAAVLSETREPWARLPRLGTTTHTEFEGRLLWLAHVLQQLPSHSAPRRCRQGGRFGDNRA